MTKLLIAALATVGAICLTAPVNAAPAVDGITKATEQTDMSARRRYHRRYYAPRVYRAPAYYGYYGPTYYSSPYRRPAPVFFGLGGYW